MRSPRRAPLPAEPQSGAHVNKPITPLVADTGSTTGRRPWP